MRRRAVLLLTVMTAVLVMVASPAWADATFEVNNTADVGDWTPGDGICSIFPTGSDSCTLRAAIQEANATTAADTINFDIPSSGVKTIEVGRPTAANPDGNGPLPDITQPVTIDGYTQRPCSSNPAPCSRPNTQAVGTNAVLLIELNGSNLSGGFGLELQASNTTIKGLVVNRFNGSGILIYNPTADPTDNKIEGNFIGTDPSGTQDLGNGDQGVWISSSNPSSNNTVGGTSFAARNLISGNAASGVSIDHGNFVNGNLIGTKKDGTTALGNENNGVQIFGLSNFVTGNTIAFNGGDGVAVFGQGSSGNLIMDNSIHSNGDLGIDLRLDNNDNGPTANDAGDEDYIGPNNLQNYPTITRATTFRSTGHSIVRGTLNSTPGEPFTIQLFINPAPDPSGFGEGKRLLRQLIVETDASGNASFSMKARKLRGSISATATNAFTLDTSEFSLAKKVKQL